MSDKKLQKVKIAKALKRLESLAKNKLAARAAHYDETASFPKQDFEDIFAKGLLGAMIPEVYGGLGLGQKGAVELAILEQLHIRF